MKFLPFVLKHLRRNWIRTGQHRARHGALHLPLLHAAASVLAAMDDARELRSATRLVTRHSVSLVFNLPLAYAAADRARAGREARGDLELVRRLAARQEGEARRTRATRATHRLEQVLHEPGRRGRALFRDVPGVRDPAGPDARRSREDLRGCIIGRKLADEVRLEGRRHVLPGELHPALPQARAGPFEFVVRGIYDADKVRSTRHRRSTSMYFHYKYLYEATGQRVGAGHLRGRDRRPSSRRRASQGAIDALFENSDAQTTTETEQAFRADFIAMAGNLALLLNGIGLAVIFTILLVTANTMSMAVRERRTEIARPQDPRLHRAGRCCGLIPLRGAGHRRPRGRPRPRAERRRSSGP